MDPMSKEKQETHKTKNSNNNNKTPHSWLQDDSQQTNRWIVKNSIPKGQSQ